jgi:hypothetical protein
MDYWCSFDIDSMDDAKLVEWIFKEIDFGAASAELSG